MEYHISKSIYGSGIVLGRDVAPEEFDELIKTVTTYEDAILSPRRKYVFVKANDYFTGIKFVIEQFGKKSRKISWGNFLWCYMYETCWGLRKLIFEVVNKDEMGA